MQGGPCIRPERAPTMRRPRTEAWCTRGARQMSRPRAALAMIPGVDVLVLTAAARADLDTLVDLVVAGAVDLSSLDDGVLEEIEIVVGGWGCSVLDAALLARMPKLRLLAYAAGTVKMTVT